MKAVLDTNVLVSATFWSGPPARVLQAWVDRRFQLVASIEIIEEYREVLTEVGSRLSGFDVELDILAIGSHI